MNNELILPDPEDKAKFTVEVSGSLEDVIESGNMIVTEDGKKYYHLPFWFERVGECWHIHHLSDLPKDLVEYIVKSRLGGDNPQPIEE